MPAARRPRRTGKGLKTALILLIIAGAAYLVWSKGLPYFDLNTKIPDLPAALKKKSIAPPFFTGQNPDPAGDAAVSRRLALNPHSGQAGYLGGVLRKSPGGGLVLDTGESRIRVELAGPEPLLDKYQVLKVEYTGHKSFFIIRRIFCWNGKEFLEVR
jgi:hypothetical protein